jgi:serralysin
VAAAGVNPLEHYEQFGFKEGRNPSAFFHANDYLDANPDVAAAHVNPLDHFLQYGIYEGRGAIFE